MMAGKLCFLGCHNFHREMEAAIAAEGWDDVCSIVFPSRCGRPPLDWDELASLLPKDCDQIVIFGRACLSNLHEPPNSFPPVKIHNLEQCFHLVGATQLVDEAIDDGGYLITPGWLVNWRAQLEYLGFSQEQSGDFFHDFAKKLVLLDTGIESETMHQLADFKASIELPVERIAVGIDHTRLLLSQEVMEWQLKCERRKTKEVNDVHKRMKADFQLSMNMLSGLGEVHRESEVIAVIKDLCQMLFAPEVIYYQRVENNVIMPSDGMIPELDSQLNSLQGDHNWTDDGRGFLLSIRNEENIVGKMALHQLAYPEHRERYLNIALMMTGICGLAIENARNRKKLLEAEKMASLGILVAGVAHEINTPLGVGLTSISALQDQSCSLANSFSERTMTQTDLDNYLSLAKEECALIYSNLKRIGLLTERFREVAVEDNSISMSQFRLRDCLSDAIQSLGKQLPVERIEIRIQCDPEMKITGFLSDWTSIFVNLICNSVNHGYSEMERGIIKIQIATNRGRIKVDYSDNGRGMKPETLARIFDPFFTTNIQGGTGLGMHLIYNIITQRFGGEIRCKSHPGEGVLFHIEVPL